jgi:two-component system, chemotaxis family, protein-glutamate methylesterase/glutaminase
VKVLVADDSILFRRVMTEVLTSLPDVEVIGQTSNGKLTVRKVRELRPDLLTLDMEMPEMDGLAVLDALKQSGDLPAVIVVSALTKQGGRLTMQALQKGAFDFITKPSTAGAEQSREALRTELAPRLKALSLRLGVRNILRGKPAVAPRAIPAPARPAASNMNDIGKRMTRLAGTSRPEMVLIGVSTGGPYALANLLPALPGRLGVPVLIVQHMPPLFTQTLAENLDARCALNIREAVHGETTEADTVYIAPGGRHMRLVPGTNGGKVIQITDDPPENNCRPAVDYLFRSVSLHFPGQAMGVILTGMGSDGTLGLKLLKRHGCFVIAQDEASCVVYGMPKAAVDAGLVDIVLPLEAIAGRIAATIRGGGL